MVTESARRTAGAGRGEPVTPLVAGMFLRELMRRWPTVLFMVLMPASYFVLSYVTSDGETMVPLAVPTGDGEVTTTVLDRDVKALYLAVLGISVTSSFAALGTVQGSTEIMRRLRIVGMSALQLLAARTAVLGLIMVVSCAVFLAIFVPVVSVESFPVTVLALLLVSCVGVALGTVIGLLLPREFEAAMVLVAVAGIQMALGRGESSAERFLPYWPGVEALKSAVFNPGPQALSHLGLGAAYAVALLVLAAVIWNIRTRIWVPQRRRA